MSIIRFGIIGAGGIAAKSHLPEIAGLAPGRAEVSLIAGRKEARLRTLCDKFGVKRFTSSYDDVISDDKVDAVIIATPHTHHVSWAIKALRAGKHVLIQKPLCDNVAEADELVKAGEQHPGQVVLAMPHFFPYVYDFRGRIAEGRIGKITGGRARSSHGGPDVYYREVAQIFGEAETEDLWFFDAGKASVGALFDMGVYAVAQLIALMGTVKSVTAVTATVEKPTTLEDTATVVMKMACGAIATAETSWCDPARTWEMNIHGAAGKLVMRERGEEAWEYVPLSYDSDRAPIERRPISVGRGAGNLHEHFLDCVGKREQPVLSNVYAARHVTEVLLAALESGRTGRPVGISSRVER